MKIVDPATARNLQQRRDAPLATPTDLKAAATKDISAALNGVLATGRVFVTLTFMTTLTSPDPTDAVGVFGVRLIPDPSL